MFENSGAQVDAKMMNAIRHRDRSILDRLKDQKADLEARLADVNRAIEGLEANPELEKVLGVLSRVGLS